MGDIVRYSKADLLDNVVTSYDQTKTTVQGRAFVKTVDGKQALGPSLNKFFDVFADAGLTPAPNAIHLTENGRMFLLTAEASGLMNVILYETDLQTGVGSYVGRLQVALPDVAASTHTYRGLKVKDTGTTGWQIFIATTASVLINGGLFLVNNIDRADFIPIGFPTIQFATGNGQKAVYKLEDPANTGVGNLNTSTAGILFDKANNRIYVHNGVAATHQYYVFDTSVVPTYVTASVTGLASTDVISHAGHTFVAGDPVTFTALTGGAGLVVGTTYFVRNPVAGVSYELSASSGGALFNFTTDISAATIGRAFGTSGSNFLHKTGNLPALTGNLLLTDSEDYAVPQHTSNAGQGCAFFCTTSNMYLGQLSELTSGATTWPSLVSANMLGSPNQIITSNATQASWSNVLDRAVVVFGNVFILKQVINNVIDKIFGGTSNKYLEGFNFEPIELQASAAVSGVDVEDGWLTILTTTVGQRGMIMADLLSDSFFNNSFFVTKVMDTPNSVLKFITSIDSLYDFTGSLDVQYRTSGFGSISGGWAPIPFAEDLTLFASGQQIQFKVLFDTLALGTSIPAQLCEFFVGYESLTDNSDHWELSVDDSDNGNPSRTAFRLKKAYSSSVPTLYYRAFDLSNVLLVNHNSVSEAARFEFSTNGGVSWNSLGTIPNTVGTLVRYTFSSPPGVDIRPGLRES